MMQLPQTHFVSFDGGGYYLVPLEKQREWSEFLAIPASEELGQSSDEFYDVPEWAKPVDLEQVETMDAALPARIAA